MEEKIEFPREGMTTKEQVRYLLEKDPKMTMREIAEATGKSVGTVSYHISGIKAEYQAKLDAAVAGEKRKEASKTTFEAQKDEEVFAEDWASPGDAPTDDILDMFAYQEAHQEAQKEAMARTEARRKAMDAPPRTVDLMVTGISGERLRDVITDLLLGSIRSDERYTLSISLQREDD